MAHFHVVGISLRLSQALHTAQLEMLMRVKKQARNAVEKRRFLYSKNGIMWLLLYVYNVCVRASERLCVRVY